MQTDTKQLVLQFALTLLSNNLTFYYHLERLRRLSRTARNDRDAERFTQAAGLQ